MFEAELNDLREKKLDRHILSRSSPQGPTVIIGGRKYLNFSSNDYLGLSNDPELLKAATRAVRRFGVGAGSARLLAGGTILHDKLEQLISEFKSSEAALLFNSGHSANIGIIPAISSEGDVLFSDERNHATIIDGCRLSKAKTIVYRHRDVCHLDKLIRKEEGKRKFVITDSVFSMDGDIAPLKDLREVCSIHGALLYVDDAHGTGVLGNGRGALAHFGIKPEQWILQMGTFSKALGSFGAFAAGDKGIIQWLSNAARSFIFSTTLPPCIISASIAAVSLVMKKNKFVRALWQNRNSLIKRLEAIGYRTTSETPILPIITRDLDEAFRLSSFLFKRGIYAPAIRPPTVREPRVRISVSAAHTEGELDLLCESLKKFRKK